MTDRMSSEQYRARVEGKAGTQPNRALELQRACVLAGLDEPVLEHRFHPVRKWRLDLAWPDRLLGVEIDGGAFSGGRHTSGPGFRKDAEKFSVAATMGWRILRVLPEWVPSGQALAWCIAALDVPTPDE